MRNDIQRSSGAGGAPLTEPSPLRQSRHARRRAAQRNLTTTDVEYILTWGREIRRTGALFYCLAVKDIPAHHRRRPTIMRLAGAVVIASRDGEVITLYRNGGALRDIQRKLKYRITPGVNLIAAEADEDGNTADVVDVAEEQ